MNGSRGLASVGGRPAALRVLPCPGLGALGFGREDPVHAAERDIAARLQTAALAGYRVR